MLSISNRLVAVGITSYLLACLPRKRCARFVLAIAWQYAYIIVSEIVEQVPLHGMSSEETVRSIVCRYRYGRQIGCCTGRPQRHAHVES